MEEQSTKDQKETTQKKESMTNQNKLVIVAIVVTIVVSLLIGGLILLGNSNDIEQISEDNEQSNKMEENRELNSNEDTDEENENEESQEFDLTGQSDRTPLINTLYLGEYENEQVFFFTDEEKQVYYEDGEERKLETIGVLIADEIQRAPFDYNNLTDPIRLIELDDSIVYENLDALLSDNQQYLLISTVEYPEGQNIYEVGETAVYKIDLSDDSISQLWSKPINDIEDTAYGNNAGAASLTAINSSGSHIVVGIFDCYACGPGPTSVTGQLVLNTSNSNELYLGDVFYENIDNELVYYRESAEVEEECEGDGPYCSEGTVTVAKPTGEILSEDLP